MPKTRIRCRFLVGVVALCGLGAAAGCNEDGSFGFDSAKLGLGSPQESRPVLRDPCSDVARGDTLKSAMLDAVNAKRAEARLRPLKLNPTLTRMAEFYACRLVDGGFFSHDDPFDGSTVDSRAADFSYAFRKIGENLAAGQETPAAAVAEWMESTSHKANILDPGFVEIGIAVKCGGELGRYWVIEFGRPLTAPAATVATRPSENTPSSSPEATSQPKSSAEIPG